MQELYRVLLIEYSVPPDLYTSCIHIRKSDIQRYGTSDDRESTNLRISIEK